MMYPILILLFLQGAISLKTTEFGRLSKCVSLDESVPSNVLRCDVMFEATGEFLGTVEPPLFIDEVGKKYSIKYPFSLIFEAPVAELGIYKPIGVFEGLYVNVTSILNQTSCPLVDDNNGTLCQRSELRHSGLACHKAQLNKGLLSLVFGVRQSGTESVHLPYRFKIDGITGRGDYNILRDQAIGPINFTRSEVTSHLDLYSSLYFEINGTTTVSYLNEESPIDSDWFNDGLIEFARVCEQLTYIEAEPYVRGLGVFNTGFSLQPFKVNASSSGYIVGANFFPKGQMSLSFSAVVGLLPPAVSNITVRYDCETGIAWVAGVNSGNAGSVTIMVHYSDGPTRSNQYKEIIVSGLFQIRVASYYITEIWIEDEKIKPSTVCKANYKPTKPTDPPARGPSVPSDPMNGTLVLSAPMIPTDQPTVDDPIELKASNPGVESDEEGTLTVLGIPINGYWYIIASAIAAVAVVIVLILGSVCVYKSRQNRRIRANLSALLDTKRA